MISFSPFYKTLREKNISTYKLINQYGISRSLLDRIKHNKPMTTATLNELCNILNCDITDIIEYTKD
ncbi:MAG: helix-turn-helix transcriptional regulator [Clostridia bacterium]|nr:helix-turn-helix transcriptional regulator [Clostridia bacterium]